jgi:hypothetical protein
MNMNLTHLWQRSIYSNLVQELREEDPDEYLKYLRMTTTTFNILLEKVRPYIKGSTLLSSQK